MIGSALLVGGLLLSGCGTPPELLSTPAPTTPGTTSPTTATQTQTPTRTITVTPTAGTVAVACAGWPAGTEVVTLLRRTPGLLPDGLQVTVTTGPMCAADWQYTVVEVAGHEPLQAVSRGRPNALTLVTAGTDVCAIPVRAVAPPAIQKLACDGPAGGFPPG